MSTPRFSAFTVFRFSIFTLTLLVGAALLLTGCGEGGTSSDTNYGKLPLHAADGSIQAVIEIPAGTVQKREYDYDSNTFPIDRAVKYLPYPANYGFLPGTFMDPEQGGDGDALDVLILAESVPTATVMNIKPIGILQLVDGGEVDDKVIAVPADPKLRLFEAENIHDLDSSVLHLIEQWFSNYKGAGKMQFVGWQGSTGAMTEIERWTTQP